ncbi:MAG: hypothetical protein RL685_142 [Pseudomonadota bacterium]|jgi:hypothetical protein
MRFRDSTPPKTPARWRGVGLTGAAALAACLLASACFGPESERLSCDDVLPAGTADFRQIQALILLDQASSKLVEQGVGKGCAMEPCHNANTQRKALRLDTPELIYDELSQRPELFYSILASGTMPEEGERWTDDDLKILRSWYCDGAFPP